MFTEIPNERPTTPLLDSVTNAADLRLLALDQLEQFNHELREFLIYSVGQSGGHFGAGLGVVELTTALHYVFDTPNDKLVWDVGHQAYPHKIITGRREQMTSIRSREGLAAFPLRSESEYDTFGVGHSSTSISAAMGMSLGMRAMGKDNQAVAIIGDGAMTAGMAFEALNHAGHEKADILVILNDNDMAISDNVGALNKYFTRLWSSPTYASFREGSKKILQKSTTAWEFMRKTEEHMKAMVAPGIFFEELGFNYYGPIDGHDTEELVHTLANLKKLPGPKILHIVTKKGKGYAPAEAEQIKYHALKKQNIKPSTAIAKPTYSNVFGNWLCDMAEADERLMGITPAMREGSDMIRFSELYPKRYFDVAISEQHAVTLAGGMACEGAKPVVAIYSTFLQRGYDQLIHDVALQNLDVLFAIDRAGLVGEDGPTHHGAYDYSFLRPIPNMVIMAPSNEDECRQMLYTGYQYEGPAAVRYPRGSGAGIEPQAQMQLLPIGKGIMRRTRSAANEHKSIAVLAFGSCVNFALAAAEELAQLSIEISVADMRFVKPLDEALVAELASSHDQLICVEENAIMGGAGSAVLEYLAEQGITTPCQLMGIPDRYIEHASPTQQLTDIGIDQTAIVAKVKSYL
ncbi:MAG: 1-deoxy-D-xylulose-5-phosphate synthase [Oleispira sp.]|nr:1-deoxy-D-xylulose-5-phosphate synthase [Oleispira sp.]MBL4880677.1 1-deoxy-D-xylulose-5-phosphate synthase [Oleispira sp.]